MGRESSVSCTSADSKTLSGVRTSWRHNFLRLFRVTVSSAACGRIWARYRWRWWSTVASAVLVNDTRSVGHLSAMLIVSPKAAIAVVGSPEPRC